MNVLVTGISKGLGLEITKTLLKRGNKVFGLSRSITPELKNLIEEFPNDLKHLHFDLKNIDQIKTKLFKEFIGSKTPLHAFVNNAAVAYDDLITNMNIDPLKNMFDINVFTPMLITKYAIRNMLLNKLKGSIVHISSISVHTGYKGLSMYAGSKGALEAFSKNTAREWGPIGVRSNCIVGGFMETEMSSSLESDVKQRIYNRTSLKKATKLFSVAETVAFLIGDGACSITGQNLHVDSGTI